MPDHEVGDIVKLLSGGPDMTVEEREYQAGDGYFYKCVWFDSDNQLERGEFSGKLLKPANA